MSKCNECQHDEPEKYGHSQACSKYRNREFISQNFISKKELRKRIEGMEINLRNNDIDKWFGVGYQKAKEDIIKELGIKYE